MYDEFSTVYIDYLANYQTGVTRLRIFMKGDHSITSIEIG